MRIDLRAEQAENLLRGLLKSLYTLGFAWIVKRVNTVLHVGGAWPEQVRARAVCMRLHAACMSTVVDILNSPPTTPTVSLSPTQTPPNESPFTCASTSFEDIDENFKKVLDGVRDSDSQYHNEPDFRKAIQGLMFKTYKLNEVDNDLVYFMDVYSLGGKRWVSIMIKLLLFARKQQREKES